MFCYNPMLLIHKLFWGVFMKRIKNSIHYLPEILLLFLSVAALLILPKSTSEGVKQGLSLLGNVVIPSLFPFFFLSSYLCKSNACEVLCKIFKKPVDKIFKTSGYGITAIIMGLTGGYPTGAKTVFSLYESGKITKNEAERLFYWCVNAGPAFTVNAVGSVMLGNTKSGIILYVSMILSSLTIGFFTRFFSDGESTDSKNSVLKKEIKSPLTDSVYEASEALINASAWILLFSCFFGLLPKNDGNIFSSLFIKSIFEVTSGCRACAGKVSLPVISAVIGFSGICVFCQIMPYLKGCKVKLKNFVCARLLNTSLCAFYTSLIINLFPVSKSTVSVFSTPFGSFTVSYTAPVFAVLLTMCGVFIFELDNRKKI